MSASTGEALNADFLDMIGALVAHGAVFLLVGAHALAAHGVVRATGDLDLFIRPDADNARRIWRALADFGAPVAAHQISEADLARPGVVYQIGIPPRRIDLLTAIDGIGFDEAWAGRLEVRLGALVVPVIGRSELLANKRASARPKDRLDVQLLLDQGTAGSAPDGA